MTKSEKEAIIKKVESLGFKSEGWGGFIYDLPFGLGNTVLFDIDDLEIGVIGKQAISDIPHYSPIRKIESPEDLQLLFDAICPEKFRLPFG